MSAKREIFLQQSSSSLLSFLHSVLQENQFSLQSGQNHNLSPWVFVCGGFSTTFVPWLETSDLKHTAVERLLKHQATATLNNTDG